MPKINHVWWHMPVIPVILEAETGESLEPRRQKLQTCGQKGARVKTFKVVCGQVWWLMPIIPALWEAEAGESPEDCPPEAGDFRAQQCSAHNDVKHHGQFYEWLPVSNDPDNPCSLKCQAKGTALVVELAPKVLDGTRCYTESLDMCISGLCQKTLSLSFCHSQIHLQIGKQTEFKAKDMNWGRAQWLTPISEDVWKQLDAQAEVCHTGRAVMENLCQGSGEGNVRLKPPHRVSTEAPPSGAMRRGPRSSRPQNGRSIDNLHHVLGKATDTQYQPVKAGKKAAQDLGNCPRPWEPTSCISVTW
ncbi:ADAMTS-like protein 1, partial [Plecturocebus cupreus]